MKAGTAPFRLLGFGNSDKFVACWRSALTTKLVRSIFVLCCAERVAHLMEKNNCWNLLLYLQKNIYVCQHWILTFLNPKLVENCVFWSSSMKLPHFHSCLVVFWRKLRNENDCPCYILLKKLKVSWFSIIWSFCVCVVCACVHQKFVWCKILTKGSVLHTIFIIVLYFEIQEHCFYFHLPCSVVFLSSFLQTKQINTKKSNTRGS